MSKTFDDGVVRIYKIESKADPGDMPNEELTEVGQYYFGYPDYGLSMNQVFQAQQHGHNLDTVIDIDLDRRLETGMIAKIDESQYRLFHVQHRIDEEGLWFTRLSLEANDHDPD